MNRDSSIDILRGLAILTMLLANLSGSILAEPHPFVLSLSGSFAAPLFILLAGMMVGHGLQFQKYRFSHFLKRGIILILLAALLCDMLIWGVMPFLNMEVLYLIGVALPVTALFLRLNRQWQWLLIALVFLLTPVLQNAFGYKENVFGYFLPKDQAALDAVLAHLPGFAGWPLIRQWLIDGWFPLFPWLGYALLGGSLAQIRWQAGEIRSTATSGMVILGTTFLLIGIVVWIDSPGPLYSRLGFSELFYPPTPGYILTSFGVLMLLFSLVDSKPYWRGFAPLTLFGQVALFLYLFHWAVIEKGIDRFAQSVDLSTYGLWLIALIVICLAAAWVYRELQYRMKRWRKSRARDEFS